jgi:hypothetical protein
MMFLFVMVKAGAGNNNETTIAPRIVGGTQIVSFNHVSVLEEFGAYEGSCAPDNNGSHGPPNSSFGAYLHHKPDRALVSLGCAIGLAVHTLWRRHQSSHSPASHPLQQRHRTHPDLATLHTAVYRPRFYNLAPSAHVRMVRRLFNAS